jgi:2-dehydropantoate 2-reductase
MERSKIAVVGAGAVGCYYGGMLARSGASVTFIGRPQHVEAMNRNGLTILRPDFQETIPVQATTRIEAAGEAEIVLFCVKTLDTESAARAIAPILAAGATVVDLQNGVDNVDRIRSVTGWEAIPAVVYVACEMTAPDTVKHNGRGELVIGDPWGRPEIAAKLEGLAAMFERASVSCGISATIRVELWTKMVLNCVYNALSALCRAKYGRLVSNPLTRELMRLVVDEAVAVAGGLGVTLSASSLYDLVLNVGESLKEATSSMAQDIARGRLTEIDSLNGYLVRKGAELGIPTPINKVLYAAVKVLEERI